MNKEEILQRLENIRLLIPGASRQCIQNGDDPEKVVALFDEVIRQLSEIKSDIESLRDSDGMDDSTLKR